MLLRELLGLVPIQGLGRDEEMRFSPDHGPRRKLVPIAVCEFFLQLGKALAVFLGETIEGAISLLRLTPRTGRKGRNYGDGREDRKRGCMGAERRSGGWRAAFQWGGEGVSRRRESRRERTRCESANWMTDDGVAMARWVTNPISPPITCPHPVCAITQALVALCQCGRKFY